MTNAQTTRIPGVAGTFYPAGAAEIRMELHRALEREASAIDRHTAVTGMIAGGVVPHAGMVFCARQAVHFFELVRRSEMAPDTVVIVHPNHRGVGPPVSVDGHAAWESPLGNVRTDTGFSEAMGLPASAEAQEGEHSAEVLVPYLQYFLPGRFAIVPVNMLVQHPENAALVAKRAYEASKRLQRKVLFLASSDFSHFLTPEESAVLDDKVLHRILERDPEGVCHAVRRNDISVCGYGPVMALMFYAALADPGYRVRLLRRGHSGEVSPSRSVVNYITLLFETHAETQGV